MLRIGELARRADVTPRTVRFYIQEQLLPQPQRVQKNLALYEPESVEKIRAIKKAQKERFLPLVMIRRILEENNFDYSALERVDLSTLSEEVSGSLQGSSRLKNRKPAEIPPDILRKLENKKIIDRSGRGRNGVSASEDRQLLGLLSRFHQYGMEWEDLTETLSSIRKQVETVAEREFGALISGMMKNPSSDFHEMLGLEDRVMQSFISRTRYRALKSIISRYKNELDYTLLSSADEGYAVDPVLIEEDLEEMKRKLKPGLRDKRLLNDLALGYSCQGNLDLSLRYLQRIRKFDPEDPETRVRWIWYRRFTQRQQDQNRLKRQMEKLVDDHPDFPIGRAFMAIWHAFDMQGTDESYEILRLANACLHEIEAAGSFLGDDLHEWTLVQYIKGRLCGWLQVIPGYIECGIGDFEKILLRKAELDLYYKQHKPFFIKWLWPNVHLFLGILYNQVGRFGQAADLLENGRHYQMQSPYQDHLESEMKTAMSGMAKKQKRR